MTPFRSPSVPMKPAFAHARLGTSLRVDPSGVVTCNPRFGAVLVLVLSIHTSLAIVGLLTLAALVLGGVMPAPREDGLGFLSAAAVLGVLFAATHLVLRRYWQSRSFTIFPAEHAVHTRDRRIPFSAIAAVTVARDMMSSPKRELHWISLTLHDGAVLRLCKAHRTDLPSVLQALTATGLPTAPETR